MITLSKNKKTYIIFNQKTFAKVLHTIPRIIFFNLFLLVYTTPLLAEDDPVLKEKIVVHNDTVTLGDLFLNAGIRENVAVFQSPKIGTTGIISANRVALAAKRHGLVWANPGEIKRITVERPSRFISLENIEELLTDNLAAKASIQNTKNVDILFSRGTSGLHLDSRNKAPLVVINSQLNLQNGVFRAVIGTEELSGNVPKKTYTGKIIQTTQAVVLTKNIQTGSIITSSDVKVAKFQKNRINSGHIQKTNFIIGKSARRLLAANVPIFKNDVQVPKIIKRNETVQIQFQAPGLQLKTKGKAMQDGAKGDEITVMNNRSKRKIQAIVTGPGIVSVSTLAPNNTIRSTVQTNLSVPPPAKNSSTEYIVR